MPPTIADAWKLRALLDTQSLGRVDGAGMTIRLNNEVMHAIQRAKTDQHQGAQMEEEEKESAAADANTEQPYTEQLPSPAHQVSTLFPLFLHCLLSFNRC